jgi:hypothetical protein
MQYEEKASIFGCDDYSVFSNASLRLGPGLNASLVDGDLTCERPTGHCALSTAAFLQIWGQVFLEGSWRAHDWTVKAEPDTVFFPNRLRLLLDLHEDGPQGVYLGDCEDRLPGALEVLSKLAIATFEDRIYRCDLSRSINGQWGEDVFMDHCLGEVLKVKRRRECNMLKERSHLKHPDSVRYVCTSGVAAFHPFDSLPMYKSCLLEAWSTPIRWAANPTRCLRFRHHDTDRTSIGSQVSLDLCTHAEHVSLPSSGRFGQIRLTRHPSQCLGVAISADESGVTAATLMGCSKSNLQTQFLFKGLGETGRVRWAAQPAKCLTVIVDGEDPSASGSSLELMRCEDNSASQLFAFFPVRVR